MVEGDSFWDVGIQMSAINPSSRMIFYEMKIAVAYAFKRTSHGPMQTPMRCFYRSKDSPLNKLSNDL